jgi:hypothetical protein
MPDTLEAPAPAAPAAPAQAAPATEIMSDTRDIRPNPALDRVFRHIESRARQSPLPESRPLTPEQSADPAAQAEAAAKPPVDPQQQQQQQVDESPDDPNKEPGLTDPEKPADLPDEQAKEPPTESPQEPSPADAKGKKLSPWRLVDQWKSKTAQLERELAELRANAAPPAEVKALKEQLAERETKLKEYEDEIRYVNYQKSPEYIEKYQKPYEAEFKRAVAELSEVNVTNPDGTTRPANAEDMLALVQLPLGRAREVADQLFGPFADDALMHRRAIKDKFDTMRTALDEAKTRAADYHKQKAEQETKFQSEAAQFVAEAWERANRDTITDKTYGQYFTPREGDREWNQRLAKGSELVDRAFRENPYDPKLNPAQREEVIRRHAAIRNRAAGWGALRGENIKLRSQISALETELKAFKKSEPGQGASTTPTKTADSPDFWGKFEQTLKSKARPY